jgi:hypothetical protein
MNNVDKQRRLSIRYEAKWPVSIFRYHLKMHCKSLPHHMTQTDGQIGFVSFLPQTWENENGFIRGETINISVGGALISCCPVLASYEIFQLTIKPPNRHPLIAIGQVVDSGSETSEGQGKPFGMGIRFVHMSNEDRRYIFDNVPKRAGQNSIQVGGD